MVPQCHLNSMYRIQCRCVHTYVADNSVGNNRKQEKFLSPLYDGGMDIGLCLHGERQLFPQNTLVSDELLARVGNGGFHFGSTRLRKSTRVLAIAMLEWFISVGLRGTYLFYWEWQVAVRQCLKLWW